MRNEFFLNQAERLRPALLCEEIISESEHKAMKDGDEIIFDLKDHHVGYVELDLSCSGHHQDAPAYLQIRFAEIKEELYQDTDSYEGWISKSWIQEEKIHIDVLPVTYKLERRYAFRYIAIKVLAVSNNFALLVNKIRVTAVSSADYKKIDYRNFTKDDALLDKVSIRTLHSCMQEVFEDGPKRDRRLWLGDLRLEALANYQTFRNYDLVKRCLYLFAGSTLDEGRLSSNIFLYPQVECDYQTMFDYTLFFIDTLWDYYEETKDIDTLKELEPVCMRQFELLKNCFDDNDVLDTSKAGNIFIDWNFDLDKQAAGQAVYIYALKDLLRIEECLGKETEAISEEIEKKTAAAEKMYDSDCGLFRSGKQKQISYASQIWMILAGVTDKGRQILKELKDHEAVGLKSPYAWHHYIQAMIDCGMKEEAYQTMHDYWMGMIEKGTDTFWEIYDPEDPDLSPYGGIVVNSFCHAWSCTPTYFLRKYFK